MGEVSTIILLAVGIPLILIAGILPTVYFRWRYSQVRDSLSDELKAKYKIDTGEARDSGDFIGTTAPFLLIILMAVLPKYEKIISICFLIWLLIYVAVRTKFYGRMAFASDLPREMVREARICLLGLLLLLGIGIYGFGSFLI